MDSCTGTALLFLVDRSGSMSGLPIDMAKKAAEKAVDTLAKNDCFGLMAFDSAPTRIVAMSLVVDKAPLKARIATITAGGGTDIATALISARTDIKAAPRAKQRAVLLLTDGQSPLQGMRDAAGALAKEGALISVWALGTGVDKTALEEISKIGNGRIYKFGDPADMPRLMEREITYLKTGK